jgi:uncharacterized protein YegP (UPF0339 family)
MSARLPRWEIVTVDTGWHLRFRASNGRVLLSSEVYTRLRAAERAMSIIAATVRELGQDIEVRRVDERTAVTS